MGRFYHVLIPHRPFLLLSTYRISNSIITQTDFSYEESTSEDSSTAVSSDEDSDLGLHSARSDASDGEITPLFNLQNKEQDIPLPASIE